MSFCGQSFRVLYTHLDLFSCSFWSHHYLALSSWGSDSTASSDIVRLCLDHFVTGDLVTSMFCF